MLTTPDRAVETARYVRHRTADNVGARPGDLKDDRVAGTGRTTRRPPLDVASPVDILLG
jgi:hypothetical protein